MKAYVAILLVALAGGAIAHLSDHRCPSQQESDWTIEWLMPHPDCDKFFKCTNGVPVVQHCPSGLLYNSFAKMCDYPQNVICGTPDRPEVNPDKSEETPEAVPDKSEEVPEVEPEPAPETEESEFEEVIVIEFLPNNCPVRHDIHWLLPKRWSCTKFYACVFGKKIERDCPKGLHFNRGLQVCDYPYRARCRFF